ncbi:aminoglycoside 6-adenylyltransferase [Thalassobacillus pellis]|uniref:aminoglycoside 6-adenylyltransferase n=1 Tax=Thalassobacillus pellis TaxID=748008 RepID=UPI001960C600|nr:aminoglycoside 6-adenylyltransferase [Thalassobacillus pellis]MBM7553254.1 aminoglycoside 6-adenylyltransferase [Thalassobacillus pellis]
MRTSQEMMDVILGTAKQDARVRAVIMNGSRVNPLVTPDRFQDYDIVYFVSDIESFTRDHSWVDVFGERLIMQMPDAMQLYSGDGSNPHRFAYLMQFTDGNRIDLTLITTAHLPDKFDSLSKVLLDKDGIIPFLPEANDSDYHVKKPSEKDFAACSNEFWWVSTYVAKGLWRRELPYAKAMMEGPVRNMLERMIAWYIGTKNEFGVSVGSQGKYFEYYLDQATWNAYVATFTDGSYENCWRGLFAMCDLFIKIGGETAESLHYHPPVEMQVYEYLEKVRRMPQK